MCPFGVEEELVPVSPTFGFFRRQTKYVVAFQSRHVLWRLLSWLRLQLISPRSVPSFALKAPGLQISSTSVFLSMCGRSSQVNRCSESETSKTQGAHSSSRTLPKCLSFSTKL